MLSLGGLLFGAACALPAAGTNQTAVETINAAKTTCALEDTLIFLFISNDLSMFSLTALLNETSTERGFVKVGKWAYGKMGANQFICLSSGFGD